MTSPPLSSRTARYRRMAATVTHQDLLSAEEKAAVIAAEPVWRRRNVRRQFEAAWAASETAAAAEVEGLVAQFGEAVTTLDAALERLLALGRPRLRGKVEDERRRLVRARTELAAVHAAAEDRDFEAVAKAMQAADRELWALGGPLTHVLNEELQSAAYGRELRTRLAENQQQRKEIRHQVEELRGSSQGPEAMVASAEAYRVVAQGYELIAEAIAQNTVESGHRATRVGTENATRVVPPQELPQLDDVGGLDAVKAVLRRTLGVQLEQPEQAARYGVVSNGILLYGPPGTGKTLLARAVAGEYGLRYLRVSPAVIASPYAHETARNLARVFDLARQSVPCVLFLDEVDALAAARTGLPSAEHRELVTQLLTLMEEYRSTRGLVIMAATNALDLLDSALREGRFDTRIAVPLPDSGARQQILTIHLRARGDAVTWSEVDVDDVVGRTAGRSGAALEQLVMSAAERALQAGRMITQADLVAAANERVGRDRVALEDPVHWDDLVLPVALERRLRELLRVVQRPELAAAVGIQVPAGVLLYGPPGTGKTSIAKALASETQASFYEISAADLLSKWVGESESRVAALFERARDNRPSIVFIDEIESLLRRRSSTSSAPWEERVVAQFLRELDGLRSAAGVFLVGATNRIDIIDDAVVERRLQPLEVPLPDLEGRRRQLEKLFSRVRLDSSVDFDQVAHVTDGLSGADLKHLRDEAGLKALGRNVNDGARAEDIRICAADVYESLQERRLPVIPE